MAKKVLRNRSQFTTTVDPKLIEEIRILSDETGIPISKLIDKAIELLIVDFKQKGFYK